MILERLSAPIVLAPLGGGPSTPQLAAAVSEAGGLGFLASGYLTAEQTREQITAARELTSKPLGVNVFVPTREAADSSRVRGLRRSASRLGAASGRGARWPDPLRSVRPV